LQLLVRRAIVLAAALAGALAAAAVPAAAAPQPLAPVAVNVPISAAGGWVAWSAPVAGGGFGLFAWHAGAVAQVPVAPRPQPFDLDLGTDAQGRPVATFSRCAVAPVVLAGRTEAWSGTGCRVRVVDLATGRERAGGVPRPPGTSDTTPSMWRGRIAFARRDVRRHRNVAHVLWWSPSTRRLTALAHGAMPTDCPYAGGCIGMTVLGAVDGLDLGARFAAFRWLVQAPGIDGHVAWEVRADRLSDGRSRLVGSGFLGEACTGGTDATLPSLPSAEGSDVWFTQRATRCYVDTASLVRVDVGARRAAFGALDGEILQSTRDGDALYALVAPEPQGEVDPTCAADAPCTIERLDTPSMVVRAYRPRSPFF
jgi:hypothetical protein